MDELRLNTTFLNEYGVHRDLVRQKCGDCGPFIKGFGCPSRLDRDKQTTGKEKGRNVCLYVNERWSKIVIVPEQLCTPYIELLSVSLRPMYLPREFPQLFVTYPRDLMEVQRAVKLYIRKAKENH